MSASDDRMHADTPGLVPGRGHERHEEPVTDADRIGLPDEPAEGGDPDAIGSTVDHDQAAALGGDAAARSGVGELPED